MKRGNREPGIRFQVKKLHVGKRNPKNVCVPSPVHTSFYFLVEMRNTCQVTNQSSHGELSFHHNPHPSALLGLVPLYSRVIRSGGTRMKHAAHPTYCHCCELCALKQKPGVLLANQKGARACVLRPLQYTPNPNCRPYSSPHQVPKHKMLWYIEKGTLREVGKIDA